MSLIHIILGALIIINVITFFIMAYDKHRSVTDGRLSRVPEGLIFFMAAAFGSLGVYLGMILLRHKTRRWYFQLGIPLLMAQNAVTILFILDYLSYHS